VQKSALPILLIFSMPAAVAAHSIPGQSNLKALFAAVGRMHNIDPDLLEAMAEVESGGDSLSVSHKGALGLMQLMPTTASAFSVLDPFNPVANVMGAADFLDYLRNRLAQTPNLQGLPALLAAYNAGPGAVEKYGGMPPYAETHKYVRRVIEQYTNDLRAQAAVAPVLILVGPKPYVMQLRPGSIAAQPEPVLISADGDGSVPSQLVGGSDAASD
jgi:soluble lytic murein transglycosylase-like protein